MLGLGEINQETLKSLCLVGEELRLFDFSVYDDHDVFRKENGEYYERCKSATHDLNTLLTACLRSSTKLESLSLHIDSSLSLLHIDSGHMYGLGGLDALLEFSLKSLGPTLVSRTWEALNNVEPVGLRLGLSDLAAFVRNLSSTHTVTLCIPGVGLTNSGPWAEALRVLREESSADVGFGPMLVAVGVEWDLAGRTMDVYDMERQGGILLHY